MQSFTSKKTQLVFQSGNIYKKFHIVSHLHTHIGIHTHLANSEEVYLK